jgi:peptide/nickel transport system permease protein
LQWILLFQEWLKSWFLFLRLFLIIAIVAIAKPSIILVMAIIGMTTWTGIARFIRAELLKVRNLEFIESAHALGFSEMRTLFRHAIPNALSPVLIAIAFGIAAAILIESTLSFLGIGVPAETLTWGSVLSAARQSPTAWWLAIFPGFAIFLTVTVYNLVGEGLTDALDPRQKK